MPSREDQPLNPRLSTLLAHWKSGLAVALTMLPVLWYTVTWSYEQLQTLNRVPEIEKQQTALRQAQQEMLLQQRLTQQQVEMLSTQQERNSDEILEKLEVLVERKR